MCVSICLVSIPASQLGVRIWVHKYLGLDGGTGLDHASIVHLMT